MLLFGIAVLCAIIVLASNRFSSNREVIIYAVATGLSKIPASLIVVLTITMAAGTKTMVKRHVVVRKLDSLEALGGVTGEFQIFHTVASFLRGGHQTFVRTKLER
jgi:Na+-exporting ATPase